jgi:tRNA-specific adenosine deaminase 3
MLTYSLDIVRGFQEEELPSIFNCMKTAIQLSKVTTLVVLELFRGIT